VVVVRIREPGTAARQASQSAGQRPKSLQVVGAKLVDRNEHDESRLRRRGGVLRLRHGGARDEREERNKAKLESSHHRM